MNARHELFRDPVFDGATDPVLVPHEDGWLLFYTQRRATHPDPGPGVAWVHGSRIGVARSEDGAAWRYLGALAATDDGLELASGALPPAADTHWAPEIIRAGDGWRMYLTEIDGIPAQWPGHARRIVEYRSDDLRRWRRIGAIPLASDRVIDAAVARCPDGRWRLWYKDEASGSITRAAVSDDLETWADDGVAIGGRAHEGPFVFPLGGWWWMLTDEWRGMAVHRSVDALRWSRQGEADAVILPAADGAQVGRHGAVTLLEDGARAVLAYFTHPLWDGGEIAQAETLRARLSAVHLAELHVADDALLVEDADGKALSRVR
ncbi:MAG: family 43 glycosylhydrolase [Microbacteriaceae bacterium]